MLLLCVIGYFLSGVYTEIKELKNAITTVLIENGKFSKDVEVLKEGQSKLENRINEHDQLMLKFYQDSYDQLKKKNN